MISEAESSSLAILNRTIGAEGGRGGGKKGNEEKLSAAGRYRRRRERKSCSRKRFREEPRDRGRTLNFNSPRCGIIRGRDYRPFDLRGAPPDPFAVERVEILSISRLYTIIDSLT